MAELITYTAAPAGIAAAMATESGLRGIHDLSNETDHLLRAHNFPAALRLVTLPRSMPLAGATRMGDVAPLYTPPNKTPEFSLICTGNRYDIEASLPSPAATIHLPVFVALGYSVVLPPEGYIGLAVRIQSANKQARAERHLSPTEMRRIASTATKGIARALTELRKGARFTGHGYKWGVQA